MRYGEAERECYMDATVLDVMAWLIARTGANGDAGSSADELDRGK